MNIAVIGYGNLGKALHSEIQKDKSLNLVGIFSRRRLTLDSYVPFKNLEGYKKDIDVALLTFGSFNDLSQNVQSFVNLDTVDSFDTHSKISTHKFILEKTKPNNISLVSVGWDPGILSLIRGIFCDGNPTTVWGKGISQGHSNALRAVKGVIDGVAFTLPKPNYDELVKNGESNVAKLHERICYVACVEKFREQIKEEIENIPNYFEGYDTKVVFCAPNEIRKYKKQTGHKGQIFAHNQQYKMRALLEISNNAQFTAQIMLKYAKIIPTLKKDGYKGALDVLDIPLKYLTNASVL